MRKAAIPLVISMIYGPAWAQTAPASIPAPHPVAVKPAPAKPVAAKPAQRGITKVSQASAPTFDEGTYQRIIAAMLSYASIEVRGGWPSLPANTRLALGANSPEVALLRRR